MLGQEVGEWEVGYVEAGDLGGWGGGGGGREEETEDSGALELKMEVQGLEGG